MLRHAENYSIYGTGGTGRTNLLLRSPWVSLQTNAAPSTANPRGDGTCHQRAPGSTDLQGDRFAFGSANLTEFILGQAFYHHGLPTDNTSNSLFEVNDSNNDAQVYVGVASTGDIVVKSGGRTGTQIAVTDAPAIIAGAYQFVEAYFKIDDGIGRVEVRVDGVVVINASNLDTKATSVAGCAQASVGLAKNPNNVTVDYVDLYFIDTTGAVNFDFLGDVQALWQSPTADTTVTDWTRNSGTHDFDMIKETTPDGDATYIGSSVANDRSIFSVAAVPGNTSEIIGVLAISMARKSDAGSANITQGLRSALSSPSTDVNGTSRAVTQSYAYVTDVFEVDPATGVAFTPSGINATRLSLKHA